MAGEIYPPGERAVNEADSAAPGEPNLPLFLYLGAMATVLVVDDESSVRRAFRKLLERGGLEVGEAASAQEALDQLSGRR